MKIEVKVPAMGESISEATVGTILKPSGTYVNADEELLELETDKVNQLIYAPEAGVVEITVTQGEKVKIGVTLAKIDTEARAPSAKPQKEKEKETVEEEKAPKPEMPILQPGKQENVGKSVRGTKEAYLADVLSAQAAIEKAPLSPLTQKKTPIPPKATSSSREESRRKMSKVRKVIADRLVDSLRTSAMLTTFNEVDMTHVISLREKHREDFKEKFQVKLGFMSFFVKAVVSALRHFPDFNSYIDGDEIVHREYYDIGVAVGTDKGLFVPVVRNCDLLTYAEIESTIEDSARRAREGKLTVDELQGGGFTITNGGVYGSLLSTPILNPPQCGILGMHKIMKRPVVIDDQIVIRSMMNLALSYDHRIVDGREAVSFLVHVKEHLEDTSLELLDL